SESRSGHFALHLHRNVGDDVGVQHNLGGEVAHSLDGAVGQADLRLLDAFEAVGGKPGGDVHGGDRAEQATVDACLLRQLQGQAIELGAGGFGGGQLLGLGLFDLGAAGLELFEGRIRGAAGDFLRNQVVAGVAV